VSTPTAFAAVPSLALPLLRAAYGSGELTPSRLMRQILDARDAHANDPAWIARVPPERVLAAAQALESRDPAALPLYGVPFAVKDNIDVAGLPTTAACPAFAYMPAHTAPVVQRLLDAGAVLIGKTNLDQFATGLVGTRSPYGAVPNSVKPEFICGGSSSGSASVVARGLASFALGTDTAGSGRVPAGLNNLAGLKPTRGLVSTRGVLPACRSLDCVSIFALTADDARDVLAVAAGFDAADPYSRRPETPAARPLRRLGIPASPEFFGDTEQLARFDAALEQARQLGCEIKRIDFAPLAEAAALLYKGPWVAERHAAIRRFFDTQAEAIHPQYAR
jgi:allophanate hydrolase